MTQTHVHEGLTNRQGSLYEPTMDTFRLLALISGLGENKELPLGQLERVVERLVELNKDRMFPDALLERAQETINTVRKENEMEEMSPGEMPYQNGASLDDKINLLIKKFSFYEEQARSIVKALRRTLIFLAIVWIGWKLLVWVLGL